MPHLEELEGIEEDVYKLAKLLSLSPSLRKCFRVGTSRVHISRFVHEGATTMARDVMDDV